MLRSLGAVSLLGLAGVVSPASADILFQNVPVGSETVSTTTSTPRTGGADEIFFDGEIALITSMQFGYSVATGGPAAFDARIRIWDDIDFLAGTGVQQFGTQVSDFTVAITGATPGAFITGAISLTSLPGGGVTVNENPANLGVEDLIDMYFQVDFYQPGTTTPVLSNAVTYLFDGSGSNVGYTFGSPELGGTGVPADEVYWRDANGNGTITGDEARLFTTLRANMVLQFDGTLIPEPASLTLLLAGLAMLRRR